ncbi:MAG: TlyA family RNA methyltransferase [Candidatus Bipolaricaulota bacterium]|nr:TlyA family RNA methyltransferase [Candidatus Bipolaricaulota bacterium]
MRERLDKVIKQRGLIRSRSRAQRMIQAGRIRVDGKILLRPGHPIDSEAQIEIVSREPFVGRGGEKLAAALHTFDVDPAGKCCLDIGSSTGGFTDCLLQHGADRVHSVDVGHDQLDIRLRNHPRVIVHEGINARYLVPQDIGESVDLVTIDVSFISLKLILPPLADILVPNGEIIALIKPQFEVGAEKLPGDGVVKNAEDRDAVLANIRKFIENETPWRIIDQMTAPVQGEKGNVEYLVHLT